MNKGLETLRERGFIKDCTDLQGLSDLMDRESVVFYCGADPTAPSLHIGHIVPFFAMRHLQEAGMSPIALVGGGTAMIGDPTGRTETRKMLTVEEIDRNAKRIGSQLSRIVDFSDNPPKGYGKGRVINNATWLRDLNYIEFLRDIGKHFSVNRMLTFEGVQQRLERGLSFIEFNYQLLQAYDYYMLYKLYGNRLQIGGADQWGNIVAGIDLIHRLDGPQCYGLTFNLLMTSEGKKMGKSEKGAVFLDKELYSPYDFYQYFRNIGDNDVIRMMKIFTLLPLEEIAVYERKGVNINEAKERLSFEVTKIIHGEEEAEKAKDASRALFSGEGSKENIPSITLHGVDLEEGIGILDLFTKSTLTSSNGEARRLITQGGAEVNGKRESDTRRVIKADDLDSDGEILLRSGKKRFIKVKFD